VGLATVSSLLLAGLAAAYVTRMLRVFRSRGYISRHT
jgi:hypothetical protein